MQRHLSHPYPVEFRLAGGMFHKVHLVSTVCQGEQSRLSPRVQLSGQQLVGFPFVTFVTFVQNTDRQALELTRQCYKLTYSKGFE